ncbi:hypothetical protein Vafri_15526 [Volvox africanus]|nr:hypothetical protein Vafri_15526 [Volvox africanus]
MCDEVLHQGGAGVWWLATWALAWVATHPDEDFKWSSLVPYEDETVIMGKDGGNGSSSSGAPERKCSYKQYLARVRLKSPRGVKEKLQNGMALATCCCWMPHLVDMLLGDIPIPSGPLPPLSMSPGAMAPQVAYARYCEDLWRDTPGVLDYVRRYRNTYEVFCITTDTRTDRKANMDEFRRYMAPFSELAPKPAAPVTAASASSAGFGSRSRSGSRSLSHTGIFPDAIMYQEYGGWHGFVEIACASTSFNATRQDATMEAAELEILQTLLAAGCPIDAGRVMGPRGVPGPYISPFFTAMHLGYGPEAVRHLVRAGADPLAMDLCDEVPLLSAAERGMWRELQAVFKARRKLGSMVPPPYIGCYFMTRLHSRGVTAYPPVTVFQLLLQAAVASSYLPGGAGRGRGPGDCNEDEQKEAALVIPPSPWCSYFKVIEVLVAYGMTSVPEPLMSALDKIPDRLAPEPQRSVKAVLQHLRTLLKEKAEERGVEQEGEQSKAQRQEQQRKGSLQEHGQKGEVADQKVQPQQQIASPVSLSSTHAVCCVQGERQGQQQQNEKREAGSQNKPQEKKKQQQTQKEQQRRNSEQRNEATNSDLNEVSEHAKPKLPPTQHQQQQRTTQILACSGASSAGPTSQGQGRDNSAGTDHSALSAVGDEVIAAGLVSAVTPSNDCRHCWACGKENDRAAGVKMRKCSMCCTARYCGGQCQKVHWPLHRQECKVLAAAAVKEKKKSVQQEEAEKEKKTSEVKGRAAGRGS